MAGTNKLQQSPIGGPCVILVEPQLGENIGFTARAMMNGGLSDLRIVKPRDGWPNPRAAAAASGADGVIETARIFERTEEAISDLQRVYAMTARPREMIKPVATPRVAAGEMRELVADGLNVGILFGAERKGLENDDVAAADTVIQVALNPAHEMLKALSRFLLFLCPKVVVCRFRHHMRVSQPFVRSVVELRLVCAAGCFLRISERIGARCSSRLLRRPYFPC